MPSVVTQIPFIVLPPPKAKRGFPPLMPRSCLHSLGISAMLPLPSPLVSSSPLRHRHPHGLAVTLTGHSLTVQDFLRKSEVAASLPLCQEGCPDTCHWLRPHTATPSAAQTGPWASLVGRCFTDPSSWLLCSQLLSSQTLSGLCRCWDILLPPRSQLLLTQDCILGNEVPTRLRS